MFKSRALGLRDILVDPEADLVDQVRCASALFTLHAGMSVLQDMEGDPEKRREAVLEVATELVTRAHRGRDEAP
ncbi:AcrR family transcriptional regulator OS=Streptomyces griseomycini OX=66895 GN=FHS37_002360 PE=4 SV=1 [Streptomyces griseomycini]